MNITSAIPPEYEGREQTYLKHQVLRLYLESWVQKLGRYRGDRGMVHLWYVDCFSGPWQAAGQNLQDTSIYIALGALRSVVESVGKDKVKVSAIFIENNDAAFRELESHLAKQDPTIETHPFQGEFGDYISRIDELIGDDPAFIFIDPTGWRGAAMRFIAPLLKRKRRDALINVMFGHVHRFKGDQREALKLQICEFFGLEDNASLRSLSEFELMDLYRNKMKESSGSKYSLYLAIPDPTKERTKFYLVLAGNHPVITELFRGVERRVSGELAGSVRREAKDKVTQSRGQGVLDFGQQLPDYRYEQLNREAKEKAPKWVLDFVKQHGKIRYRDLWPAALCELHLTHADLNKAILDMHRARKGIRILGLEKGKRTPKDENWIALVGEENV